MLQVGKPGEVGVVEFTDMLFTVADVLPGAILVEVNMRGANQGDVSFHNSHYRIGGAADSKTETSCQTTGDPCPAAFLLTHLRETSSTYIEDAWLWAADHDLDGDYNQQIGSGRGILIEATEGTWLVGIGSEHHTLYAYQFNNAANVFGAAMQGSL
jgi:glucan 1,3-beta-glucosidase